MGIVAIRRSCKHTLLRIAMCSLLHLLQHVSGFCHVHSLQASWAAQGSAAPWRARAQQAICGGGNYHRRPHVHRLRTARGSTPQDTNMSIMGSTEVSREKFLLGSWVAMLGVASVAATQEQTAYQTRKKELFSSITGDDKSEFRDILEVGIGGNPSLGGFSNLKFYRPGQRIVGVDPALSDGSSQVLEDAVARAKKSGLELRALGGVVEELPFDTGSFDAVVSTLVFCSVRDPTAALREVSRVLRPGGKFVFVEHILAPEEGLSLLGLRQQQELLDPLQQQLAAGCHLTRQTDQLIRGATTGGREMSSFTGTRLFSRLESMENVRVGSMWPVSEQVFGVAVK